MFNLSNVLSLLRGPLAFLFLIEAPIVRALVVVAAMLTDIVDGYLARKLQFTTRIGAILDPLMDKFFVFFVLSILFYEHTLSGWEVAAMLSRDMALFIFAVYLIALNRWKNYNYRSMVFGKITTALQFAVLLFLSLQMPVAPVLFSLFFVFGGIVLVELFLTLKTNPEKV